MRRAYFLLFFLFCSVLLITFLSRPAQSQPGWNSHTLFQDHRVYCIQFTDANTGWASTVGSTGFWTTGHFLRSTDCGNNWSDIISSNSICYRSFVFINAQTGWLIGFHGDDIGGRGCYIYKTQNSGLNWTAQYSRTDSLSPSLNSICFGDSYTGFAAGYQGAILKTTNSGTNWYVLPSVTLCDIYCIKFVNASTGFLACNLGRIYKTTNCGVNWSYQIIDSTSMLKSICFVNLYTGWVAGSQGIISVTTNSGANWYRQVYNNYSYNSIFFTSPSLGWVVAYDGIIQHTTTGGAAWDLQFNQSGYNLQCIFFVNNDVGWAGGSIPFSPPGVMGVMLNTTNGGNPAGIKQIGSEIPKQYSLSQNYPNPFNPTTKIKFDIPAVGTGRDLSLQLIIYDILGREVAILVNEQLKLGTYEVVWDGSGYPSGVYFYKLATESFSETKKMVLIK